MEKLWLYPENETAYIFNVNKENQNRERIIKANQSVIDSYVGKHGGTAINIIEKNQLLMNAICAAGLENSELVNEMPPFSEKIEKNNLLKIDDYMVAQELLIERVKKEPYLYPELLLYVHRELVKNNLDISDYDKGHFRDQYSPMIQVGYFEPIEGRKVKTEITYAFSQYAYVDKNGKENPFEKISKLHAQMVRIQPFMDGNKRMAFLITNAMLALHGFPMIDLCNGAEENENYNECLKIAIVKRDVTPLAELFENKTIKKQEEIINVIRVRETGKAIKNLEIESNKENYK